MAGFASLWTSALMCSAAARVVVAAFRLQLRLRGRRLYAYPLSVEAFSINAV